MPLIIVVLFSLIAVLMILYVVDFVKVYQIVIAIVLWILFVWGLTKRNKVMQE